MLESKTAAENGIAIANGEDVSLVAIKFRLSSFLFRINKSAALFSIIHREMSIQFVIWIFVISSQIQSSSMISRHDPINQISQLRFAETRY